jgi:hypothetical protein
VKFCKQKYKHCFVACCAALLDQTTENDQIAIVAKFPLDLQQGLADEGVVKTTIEAANVVKGLGLANNPGHLSTSSGAYDAVADSLWANPQLAGKCFIFTTHPSNHCIAVKDINVGDLVVMDPSTNDFTTMSRAEFVASKPSLYILS